MKRRAFKLLLFLLAFLVGGAIINVAVAWGCALWGAETTAILLPDDESKFLLSNAFDARGEFGYKFLVASKGNGIGITRQLSAGLAIDTHGGSPCAVHACMCGFPKHALEGRWFAFNDERAGSQSILLSSAVQELMNTHSPGFLPLRPIFPGFAINTIFYAAVLWVLFAVPVKVRRCRRIKRGVCVRCAYPVGASDLCSECGTAVHGASPPATPA